MNSEVTAETIKSLITIINHIQKQFSLIGERTGNWEVAWRSGKLMETYKNALYFSWEKYGYGWHSDFWKEGDSMLDYEFFSLHPKEIVEDLIESLHNSSPFSAIDPEGAISRDLLFVYTDIYNKINNGQIKI